MCGSWSAGSCITNDRSEFIRLSQSFWSCNKCRIRVTKIDKSVYETDKLSELTDKIDKNTETFGRYEPSEK